MVPKDKNPNLCSVWYHIGVKFDCEETYLWNRSGGSADEAARESIKYERTNHLRFFFWLRKQEIGQLVTFYW